MNFYQKPREDSPDPGQYQNSKLEDFTAETHRVTLQVRARDPLWKPDENPGLGPGKYEANVSDSLTKSRVIGCSIAPPPLRLYD